MYSSFCFLRNSAISFFELNVQYLRCELTEYIPADARADAFRPNAWLFKCGLKGRKMYLPDAGWRAC